MSPGLSPYEILSILPAWVLEEEAMGSKLKFWFRESDSTQPWLFKYPQPNTGQHWAELIAAELADVMDIRHARVQLAEFAGSHGSATESFATDGRELVHGNQILAGRLLGYDANRRFRQSEHTLGNIFATLDRVFASKDKARFAKEQLAEYLVLDAVIGNTDRHHENWGILRRRTATGWAGMLAPSFDHASSMGRELVDEGPGRSKSRILLEGRIASYSEKAPGAIYWDAGDRKGLSPLALVRRAVAASPELFQLALKKLVKLDLDGVRCILARVPELWMSQLSRDFVIELLAYNLQELRRIEC